MIIGRMLAAVAISTMCSSVALAYDDRPPVDLKQYRLIWNDEFDGIAGAKPGPQWFFFDGWGKKKWRDATYTDTNAYLDGRGHLVMRAQLNGDSLETSYIQTYDWKVQRNKWSLFGPGNGKYIEARVKLSDVQAPGVWPGVWLFSPTDTYDGDPTNGTEIDIMEYIPTYGKPTSWTKDYPRGTWNYYNMGSHWGDKPGQKELKFLNAGQYGVNLQDGDYHTFGVEWYKDSLRFYVDGKPTWTTTNGVSTSDTQALIISMEYSKGPGDAWGIHENVMDYVDKLPSHMYVDYVRVYDKVADVVTSPPVEVKPKSGEK